MSQPSEAEERPVRNRPKYQQPVLNENRAIPANMDDAQVVTVAQVAGIQDEADDPQEVSPEADGAAERGAARNRQEKQWRPQTRSPEPIPFQAGEEEPLYLNPSPYESYEANEMVGPGEYQGDCCAAGGCDSPCDAIHADSSCGSCSPYGHGFYPEGCLLDLPALVHHLVVNDRKFYSTDLLLWWNRGQTLSSLATTSTAGTAAGSAGVLGLPSTTVLFGGRQGNEMTTGFRLEIGHWFDDCHCGSLTGRLWGAGKSNFSFNANESQFPILARPFFDVSDGITPTQAAQRIAFPSDSGSLSINGSSDIYGADILFRRLARRGLGGRVDWVLGYQTMRINEDLNISSLTTNGANSPNPGSTLAVHDSFDTKNEFHGVAFGWQGFYRDRCWSLETLLKVGLGGVTRRSSLRGTTTTTNAAGSANVNEGLLARATNIGDYSSSSFAAAPEVQLAIGYRLKPHLDFTFGYSFVAVGNVIQPNDLIDNNLAVNLSTNPTGQQRPLSPLTDSTFWVQGIHFGLDWNW